MAANYLPYEPQQMLLLPESLQEWLPEGHLAHFISDAIDGLDLGAFHARYDKDGPRNQPFHPTMMVKVLVYGYATGVFSSRKVSRKLHEDVAFRVLAARNFPAHRTLRDFRALHLKELSELFVQVVRLAREMGLVKLGTIAVDGTKVKANAGRHKAMSYGHMRKAEAELKAQIEALLNKARAADEAEKNEPELDISAEIARRQDRLDAIAAARARLEQRQRDADLGRGRSDDDDQKPRGQDGKPKGGRYKRPFGVPQNKDQDNFTDPDSRIMPRLVVGSTRPTTLRRPSMTRLTSSWPPNWSTVLPMRASCPRCCRPSRTTSVRTPSKRWPMRATAARRCWRNWPITRTWSWPSGAKERATVRSTKRRCHEPQRWRRR